MFDPAGRRDGDAVPPAADCSSGDRRAVRAAVRVDRCRVGRDNLERLRSRWAGELLAPEPCGVMSDPDPDAPAVVVSAVLAARAVATLSWSDLDGDCATAGLKELEVARRTLDAAMVTGLARMDRDGTVKSRTGLAAGVWLGNETSGSLPSGRRMGRCGAMLERFSRFAAALAAGRVSVEHVEVLCAVSNPRILDQLVDAEATIVELALHSTFAEYRSGMRQIAALLDDDGAEPDCSDRDRLTITRAADGTLHLRGMFSGDHAATIETALRDETNRQFRQATNDADAGAGSVPEPATLRARAFVELIRRSLTHVPGSGTAPRADATIVIRVDGDLADAVATTADGEPLDPRTAAMLACDAHLSPVITRVDGDVLFAGRSTRLAPPGVRRVLVARDRGCIFRGCDAPPGHCDAHHIRHWQDGGETDVTNLALLCRRHHRMTHSRGWSLVLVDGQPVFINPHGRHIAARGSPPSRHDC